MKKRFMAAGVALAFTITMLSTSVVYASKVDDLQSKIDQNQQQQSELQNKIDDANSNKKKLEEEASALEGTVNSINAKAEKIQQQINTSRNEVAKTASDISTLNTQLSDVQAQEAEQYDAMKLRITYMYENSNKNPLVVLIETGSLGQMLQQMEYYNSLMEYDRAMIQEYVDLQNEIETKSSEIKSRQDSLYASLENLAAAHVQMDNLKKEAGDQLDSKYDEVDSAEDEVAALEAQMAQMKAQEKAFEKQKADLIAQQIAALQGEGYVNEDTTGAVAATSDDVLLLAALIECETDPTPTNYEGQLAVGSVVMNRVKSSKFPNSVQGVIFQSGQFTPARSGRVNVVAAAGPETSCIQAANAVIAGARNTDALFFLSAKKCKHPGVNIGGNVFFSVW